MNHKWPKSVLTRLSEEEIEEFLDEIANQERTTKKVPRFKKQRKFTPPDEGIRRHHHKRGDEDVEKQ